MELPLLSEASKQHQFSHQCPELEETDTRHVGSPHMSQNLISKYCFCLKDGTECEEVSP